MQNNKIKLILGSQSPRRRELLSYTYLPFECDSADLEEISHEKTNHSIVMDLAFQKAKAVFEKRNSPQNSIVLGADTIVCFNGEILGKPKDIDDARDILMKLSGMTHEVFTGVCLYNGQKKTTFYDCTKVYFEEISKDLLEHYIATGESMDKAGAYGIQAWSLGFIEKIEGSYSNVVGLPVNLVLQHIEEFVQDFISNESRWREIFE